MNKKTLYDVLGVAQDATGDEIKKRYKELALKFHPDKNLDNIEEATRKFNAIKDAYMILFDPKQRTW